MKVKVQFVRNITNDDHFDLTDKRMLLGKTIAYLSRDANSSGLVFLTGELRVQETNTQHCRRFCSKVLGNMLYKKFGRVCDTLQAILDSDQLQLDEATVMACRSSDSVTHLFPFSHAGSTVRKRTRHVRVQPTAGQGTLTAESLSTSGAHS